MNTTMNRQPKGVPAGGQFAATPHQETALTLAPQPATAAELLAANTETVDLVYVDYDDRLTQEQISHILAGNWCDAEEQVDEVFSDHAWQEAATIAERETTTAFEEGRLDTEWDELDSDEQDEAIHAVMERDASDPVADLLRNTPPQLMRTSLGTPAGRLQESRMSLGSQLDHGGYEARQRAISELLEEAGMDTSPDSIHEQIEELVNEGPWDWHEGVDLDIIWYGSINDAIPRPRGDDENSGQKRLDFEHPHVLLIDRMNGSGHEVTMPARLTRTLTRAAEDDGEPPATERVYLDSGAPGYSWDDVAGVHKPAYAEGAPEASWTE